MITPSFKTKSSIFILVLFVLAACSLAVYWPGVTGPYVFDDYGNIVGNTFIENAYRGIGPLFQAIFSTESGPLGRPIAMATFALNSYLAGGISSAFPFKLTNIAIHAVNGFLIFLVAFKLYDFVSNRKFTAHLAFAEDARRPLLLASAVSLLWLINPIQLTTVLYVVQRMTSLSAVFVLLSIVFYLHGRKRQINGQSYLPYLTVYPAIFWVLGIFSKENAVLLPLYLIVLEFTILHDIPLSRRWNDFYLRHKKLVLTFIILGVLVVVGAFIAFALPGYSKRPFTITERVMTESRVIVFYILLIIVPRINALGLYHDDIPLSHSLVSPWTTLPSILIIITLGIFAWKKRKAWPIASAGILFFLAGHTLESTVLPLELVHEHRNYLPSLGIFLASTQVYYSSNSKSNWKIASIILVLLVLLYSGTTYLRATQWGDVKSLFTYEVIHHPKSARAQLELSGMLEYFGKYREALQAAETAAALDPSNPAYLIEVQALNSKYFQTNPELDNRINHLLAHSPYSAFLKTRLNYAVTCAKTKCISLRPSVESWLLNTLKRNHTGRDGSYYFYLLGQLYSYEEKWNQAIEVLKLSYKEDPHYAHPLFLLASIYVRANEYNQARETYLEIEKINKISKLKWDSDLRKLENDLEKMRTHKQK